MKNSQKWGFLGVKWVILFFNLLQFFLFCFHILLSYLPFFSLASQVFKIVAKSTNSSELLWKVKISKTRTRLVVVMRRFIILFSDIVYLIFLIDCWELLYVESFEFPARLKIILWIKRRHLSLVGHAFSSCSCVSSNIIH